MRHHNANRKFGRKKNQRNALLKALSVALVTSEKIQTPEAKAKELRPHFEKLVTHAKKGTLASYRILIGSVGPKAAKKLMTEIGPRFKERKGGYTRITKIGFRASDASAQAIIELM